MVTPWRLFCRYLSPSQAEFLSSSTGAIRGARRVARTTLAQLLFLLLPAVVFAGDAKISGLRFSLGQPLDKPAAWVTIAEISQGAQKRGFLRIALLPLVVAKGVDIRFQRPEIAVLGEIQEMLHSLVKLEAQELLDVRIFSGTDPVPRLTAAEVTPKAGYWHLRKIQLRTGAGVREIAECSLAVTGPKAGECTLGNGKETVQVDLGLSAP